MADELGKGVGVDAHLEGRGPWGVRQRQRLRDSTVDSYLLDGTVPEDGKVCA